MVDDEPYHDEVRIDSIIELTEVLTKETTKLIKKHGDDPRLSAVVTSGFVTAILKLEKICPKLPFLIASTLADNIKDKK